MASYTKLKSGEWGIRIEGQAREGQSVVVRKKSGETKQEVVGKVLWTDGKVALCSIKQSERPTGGVSGGGSGARCAECSRGGKLVEDLEDGLMKHYGCCDIPPGH